MRNKYIGAFQENLFAPVLLPFTLPALRQILDAGAMLDGHYTHQQICDWAQRFALACREKIVQLEATAALEVIEDVGAQWDMFLYNTYTLRELQSMDFASVRLPTELFEEWLRKVSVAMA